MQNRPTGWFFLLSSFPVFQFPVFQFPVFTLPSPLSLTHSSGPQASPLNDGTLSWRQRRKFAKIFGPTSFSCAVCPPLSSSGRPLSSQEAPREESTREREIYRRLLRAHFGSALVVVGGQCSVQVESLPRRNNDDDTQPSATRKPPLSRSCCGNGPNYLPLLLARNKSRPT